MHNKVLFFGVLIGILLAANGIMWANDAGFPGALFPFWEGVRAGVRSPQLPPLVLTRPGGNDNVMYSSSFLRLIPFEDNFEGYFPGPWVVGTPGTPGWGLTTYRAYSGLYSLYCVGFYQPAPGPYPNNVEHRLQYGPFSTKGFIDLKVEFKLYGLVLTPLDTFKVYFSIPPDEYYEVLIGNPPPDTWQTVQVTDSNVPQVLNRDQVYCGFLFTSDDSNVAEGVYVDDVKITTTTRTVSGWLYDEYGRPLSGACVTAEPIIQSGFVQPKANVSDIKHVYSSEGYFSLTLLPGKYKIIPQKPGYRFSPDYLNVNVTNNDASTFFTARLRRGDGIVKRYAVIVGISNYAYIEDLKYAAKDAQDVYNILLESGWEASNIKLLKNFQATKGAIAGSIDWLVSSANGDDIVLFYFSGRGGELNDDWLPIDELSLGSARRGAHSALRPQNGETPYTDEFLAPYDAYNKKITDDELSYWLRGLKTRKYIVIINASESGGHLASVRRSRGAASPHSFIVWAKPQAEGQMRTQDLDDLDGGVVLTACRDEQQAYESDSLQNSVLTYFLVEGLDTSYTSTTRNGYADLNQNGQVSAEEIYNYVRPRVSRQFASQQPELWDAYPGELEFATLPTLISASSPARDQTNVSPESPIEITWRWPVNQTDAKSRFKLLDPAGNAVSGTFSWPTPNTVMRFTPSQKLRLNVPYKVQIAPGLMLDSGLRKWYGDSFTFTTGSLSSSSLWLHAAAAPTPSGGAQIVVQLSKPAAVQARIRNLAGREIAVLPETNADIGTTTLLWNGRSSRGLAVPAGQYLVQIQALDAEGHNASIIVPLALRR